MDCSPCRQELHEFCRGAGCDCECSTDYDDGGGSVEGEDDPEAWRVAQARYDAWVLRDPD